MEDGITIVEPNGVKQVAIDIDESVVAMRRRLRENRDGIRGTSSDEDRFCIHRVPPSLIGIHPTAIQPELVSIGPYHHRGTTGTNELLEFESYKWWFLNRLLSRRNNLKDLFEAAKKLEGRTRKCYDEDFVMSSSDFVEMMVLDGCFIIELFRHVCRNEDDPILSKPWLIPILTRDLLKLENQLPFFVLQTLFDLTTSTDFSRNYVELRFGDHPQEVTSGDHLAVLALQFFNLSLPRRNDEILKNIPFGEGRYSHFLALFHWSFGEGYGNYMPIEEPIIMSRYLLVPGIPPLLAFPQLPPLPEQSVGGAGLLSVSILQSLFSLIPWPAKSQDYHPVLSIQSTTQLRPSGIKFKPIKADSFLSIKFQNRVLQIPPITINDLTITVFVNCIAYVQSHGLITDMFGRYVDKYFSTYIAFLSCLINSPRDVAFLCADGIITSYSHNDHYIAGLFNKLGEKVHLNKAGNYLSQQFRDVEAYYCSHWGTFMRTYFSTPWSFISIFSASVLLILTALQTVMAILSYISKRS